MEIITTFDEWQQELDTELTKTAEGFVRIGIFIIYILLISIPVKNSTGHRHFKRFGI